jgi:rare lipoprotein A
MNQLFLWIVAVALGLYAGSAAQAEVRSPDTNQRQTAKPAKRPERSMRPQVGKASFYADRFANRKMANGRPMDPSGDNAASKTLPLGTKALVTNLQTGKSAVVTIEDRGPYVDGRIIDLSPATAEKIGLEKRQGLAPVEVRPIELPPAARVASADEADEENR